MYVWVTSAVDLSSSCSAGGGARVTAAFDGGRGGKLLRLSSRSGDGWRTPASFYTKTHNEKPEHILECVSFPRSEGGTVAVAHLLLGAGGPRVVSPPLVQASSPAGATTLKQTNKKTHTIVLILDYLPP